MMYRKLDEYVKRLEDRQQYLEGRIEQIGEAAHRERSEHVALTWAIRYIRDNEDAAADHITQNYEKLKNPNP